MDNFALFSAPRSGSTWLGQMINSSPEVMYRFQPNFAYTFPLTLSEASSSEDIERFHHQLERSKDPFVTGRLSISSKKNVEFPKQTPKVLVWKETHYAYLAPVLLKNSHTKVIGLLRSPFASIASWMKIPKEFHPEWNLQEEWRYAPKKNEGKRSHYFGFEKWKEIALLFEQLQREYPLRFYHISYSNLLRDTFFEMEQLFEFMKLPLHEQTLDFIRQSRSSSVDDAYGVFKQKDEKDDKWKEELPEYIIREIKADDDFKMLNEKYKWLP